MLMLINKKETIILCLLTQLIAKEWFLHAFQSLFSPNNLGIWLMIKIVPIMDNLNREETCKKYSKSQNVGGRIHKL